MVMEDFSSHARGELLRFSDRFSGWSVEPDPPWRLRHVDGSSVMLNGGLLELNCSGWIHRETVECVEDVFDELVELEGARLSFRNRKIKPIFGRILWIKRDRSYLMFTRTRSGVDGE